MINEICTPWPFRAVAARYDKKERVYQGAIDVGSIRIWLRNPIT
ncbi:hypothetical protein [Actinoallomurus acaciae]|uniref:Transposase n=1 Tax=Actinoallomurus acaciae TaxID=502577 RepID=A0ABV5YKA8_9ACTN